MYFRERSTLRGALTFIINWIKTSEVVHRFINKTVHYLCTLDPVYYIYIYIFFLLVFLERNPTFLNLIG